MELTNDIKAYIDSLDYMRLLYFWRFLPSTPMFQGESGKYWEKRMKDIRNGPNGQHIHITTSKRIGWVLKDEEEDE